VGETGGAGHNGLGPAPLAHVKARVEHVTKGHATGTVPCLQRLDIGGLAICVLLLSGGPCFGGDIEVEGLGGVGEELVGKGVGDLLDKSLSSQVCRARDGRQSDVFAKGQRGRLGRGHVGIRVGRRDSVGVSNVLFPYDLQPVNEEGQMF
jgi:hypothetical protein